MHRHRLSHLLLDIQLENTIRLLSYSSYKPFYYIFDHIGQDDLLNSQFARPTSKPADLAFIT